MSFFTVFLMDLYTYSYEFRIFQLSNHLKMFVKMLRPVANSSPCLFSDQMSEAEREALDDQQQQGQQGLNLKGKKKCF